MKFVSLLLVVSSALFSFPIFAQEGGAQVALGTGAATGAAAPMGGAGLFGSPLIMLLLMGGMILLMIIPQRKREKEHKKFIESLEVGKKVITNSGAIGKVHEIAPTTVIVDFGDSKVQFLKSSISNYVDNSSKEDVTKNAVLAEKK